MTSSKKASVSVSKNVAPAQTAQNGKYPITHLFTYKGRKFLFETAKCFFIEVDDIAYDVLRNYSPDFSANKNLTHFTPKNLTDKEFILSKLQSKYSRQDLEGVFREIEKLKTLGLFLPEQKEKKEEIESYINRLSNMTSSNLTLIVSQACNLACKYCYAESGTFGRDSKFMSEEMAKKSVDYLFERARGSKQVGLIFFGGEPLLNFKVIKYAVNYGKSLAAKTGQRMGFSLTTNGAVMTDEMVELLTTNRFGLKVSLDGPKEVQDEMRPFKNGRGSYDVVAKNLKKLLARRGHLSVRPTLTRHNLDVRALAKFFEEFGFTRIGFGFSTGTCFQKENYDLKHEHMEKLFKQDEETAQDIFDRLSQNLPVKYNPFESVVSSIHNRFKTRIRCGLGRGVSSVSVEGDIYPCHRYVGMENFIIGHIDQGIDKEKVKALLWDYYRVKDYCWKTCWARHLCGGPCPWYAAHPEGHHRFPDKAHCEFIRRGFEFGIWFYDELRRRFPSYLEQLVAM